MKKLGMILILMVASRLAPLRRARKTRNSIGGSSRARSITITRDDWGIAHVTGKTDADAVFGMIYAQAEDDFNRVETNYLNSMGRLAEAEGESAVRRDLRMKLFIDPDDLKKQYEASPDWLKELMNAWADGLNYYLYKHPRSEAASHQAFRAVDGAELHRRQHRRRHRDGSISKQLAGVLRQSGRRGVVARVEQDALAEPTGSNGIAIAPSNTRRAPRAAADQSAHVVLLPVRAADDERRRA